jgi:hypothetical protein
MDKEVGFDPLSGPPSDELPDWFDVNEAMRRDLEALGKCEAIVMLPRWAESDGAREELQFALDHEKELWFLQDVPVFYLEHLRPLQREVAEGVLQKHTPRSPVAPVSAGKRGEIPDDSSEATERTTGPSDASAPETLVVDPDTGGKKGQKRARFDLVPSEALWELAEHYGYGATKYDDHNWRKGYAWSLSFAALQRHAWKFWAGEDVDPESGSHHLAAVAFHALALLTFAHTHPEKDDRPLT